MTSIVDQNNPWSDKLNELICNECNIRAIIWCDENGEVYRYKQKYSDFWGCQIKDLPGDIIQLCPSK